MPYGLRSLNLSLILHALAVILISVSLTKNEKIELTESSRLIAMNFNSNGGHKSIRKVLQTSGSNSEIKKPFSNSRSSSIFPNSNVLTSSESSSVQNDSDALGTGGGTGNGDGNSEDFSSLIMEYSEPSYPKMALRRGLEGTLKVRIKINSLGIPQDITLLKSSGFDILDNSALETIRKWIFVKRESVAYYFVEKTIIFQITK